MLGLWADARCLDCPQLLGLLGRRTSILAAHSCCGVRLLSGGFAELQADVLDQRMLDQSEAVCCVPCPLQKSATLASVPAGYSPGPCLCLGVPYVWPSPPSLLLACADHLRCLCAFFPLLCRDHQLPAQTTLGCLWPPNPLIHSVLPLCPPPCTCPSSLTQHSPPPCLRAPLPLLAQAISCPCKKPSLGMVRWTRCCAAWWRTMG